jgi:hypothetical protein
MSLGNEIDIRGMGCGAGQRDLADERAGKCEFT